MHSLKTYKTVNSETILDSLQKALGLGKYKPAINKNICPMCNRKTVYKREMHADTDFNEIVDWCKYCGEVK